MTAEVEVQDPQVEVAPARRAARSAFRRAADRLEGREGLSIEKQIAYLVRARNFITDGLRQLDRALAAALLKHRAENPDSEATVDEIATAYEEAKIAARNVPMTW